MGDKLIVFGGRTTTGAVDDVWVFETTKGIWTQIEVDGESPEPRYGASLVLLDARIVLFGGRSVRQCHNDIWVFDLENYQWNELHPQGDIPSPRAFAAAATMGGSLVVFGGRSEDPNLLSDGWLFDAVNCAWASFTPRSAPSSIWPEPRYGATLAIVDSAVGQRFCLFGGVSEKKTMLRDLWLCAPESLGIESFVDTEADDLIDRPVSAVTELSQLTSRLDSRMDSLDTIAKQVLQRSELHTLGIADEVRARKQLEERVHNLTEAREAMESGAENLRHEAQNISDRLARSLEETQKMRDEADSRFASYEQRFKEALDRFDQRIAELSERAGQCSSREDEATTAAETVTTSVADLGSRLDTVQNSLDKTGSTVEDVQTRMADAIKEAVAEITGTVMAQIAQASTEAEAADEAARAGLTEAVSALAQELQIRFDAIGGLTAEGVGQLRERVQKTEELQSAQSAQVESLGQTHDDVARNVAAAAGEMEQLKEKATQLEQTATDTQTETRATADSLRALQDRINSVTASAALAGEQAARVSEAVRGLNLEQLVEDVRRHTGAIDSHILSAQGEAANAASRLNDAKKETLEAVTRADEQLSRAESLVKEHIGGSTALESRADALMESAQRAMDAAAELQERVVTLSAERRAQSEALSGVVERVSQQRQRDVARLTRFEVNVEQLRQSVADAQRRAAEASEAATLIKQDASRRQRDQASNAGLTRTQMDALIVRLGAADQKQAELLRRVDGFAATIAGYGSAALQRVEQLSASVASADAKIATVEANINATAQGLEDVTGEYQRLAEAAEAHAQEAIHRLEQQRLTVDRVVERMTALESSSASRLADAVATAASARALASEAASRAGAIESTVNTVETYAHVVGDRAAALEATARRAASNVESLSGRLADARAEAAALQRRAAEFDQATSELRETCRANTALANEAVQAAAATTNEVQLLRDQLAGIELSSREGVPVLDAALRALERRVERAETLAHSGADIARGADEAIELRHRGINAAVQQQLAQARMQADALREQVAQLTRRLEETSTTILEAQRAVSLAEEQASTRAIEADDTSAATTAVEAAERSLACDTLPSVAPLTMETLQLAVAAAVARYFAQAGIGEPKLETPPFLPQPTPSASAAIEMSPVAKPESQADAPLTAEPEAEAAPELPVSTIGGVKYTLLTIRAGEKVADCAVSSAPAFIGDHTDSLAIISLAGGSLQIWHVPNSEPAADGVVRIQGPTQPFFTVNLADTGRPTCVDICESTSRIAIGFATNCTVIFDYDVSGPTLTECARISSPASVQRVLFDPRDNNRIFVGGRDRRVTLRDYTTGNDVIVYKAAGTHTIYDFALSLEAGLLASACGSGSVVVFDLATGKVKQTLKGNENGSMSCVGFTDAGRFVVSGGEDNSWRMWECANGRETHVFMGQEGGCHSISLTGNRAVSGTGSGDLNVWVLDQLKKQALETLHFHASTVSSVHLVGTTLISGGFDGALCAAYFN